MSLFMLHTNERPSGEVIRSSKRTLRRAMLVYIRQKRAQGVPLSAILYCWRPISVRTVR